MINFTDDEVTTIWSAARDVWNRMALDLMPGSNPGLPLSDHTAEEVIQAIASDLDIENTLHDWGHEDLAERFSDLEPEEIIELLEPEFALNS